MQTPQKAATPRPKAGRGAKMTTRASVAEMRRSTHEFLDAIPPVREVKAKTKRDELHQGVSARTASVHGMIEDFRETREQNSREANIERKQTVREMMDGFRQKRAETARELAELQQSVMQARREVDARLSEIAAKRKAFAPKLARSLTRAHDLTANAQHKVMQGLAEAREHATHVVQADLQHFAKGMRHDVEAFRKSMRAEIGNGVAKPEAPAQKAAAVKAKSNGAKPAMAAKPVAAPAAKAKIQAAKPAAPQAKAKAPPKAKPAAKR